MSRPAVLALVVAPLAVSACGPSSSGRDAGPSASASASASTSATATSAAGPSAAPSQSAAAPPEAEPAPPLACPREMVAVKNTFCIDKWEASLVDKRTGIALSPYYPPDRKLALRLSSQWQAARAEGGDDRAHALDLPPLPPWERKHDPVPMAVSRAGVVPSGYLSGIVAAEACKNAGKRLCKYEEWRTACRGEQDRQFPYGDHYEQGACNIFRPLHPAMVLHGNPSIGHTDPRLNLVKDGSDPLLRRTGATPRCKSEWGDDAAWDMNGNLDEWVDDEHGRFVGGFFSRSKRDGCESSVGVHPNSYFDYSTGVRCCSSPEDAPP
ncbi:MAG TPA: SUMF1/EgtB/PvdO family nonheme iron enzyme [Minicystis sp.]|nr:SUMF1/EgtB/PvdO family nonheme iron enzyme [Minicystis sp.]